VNDVRFRRALREDVPQILDVGLRGDVKRRRYVHRIEATGLDQPMIELERSLEPA
jgi:hypothetical protein